MVTIVVPAVILGVDGADVGWGWSGVAAALTLLLGLVLIAAGFLLWLRTVLLLARIGKGTLAPWDPTRRLVAAGPYRHVRNPMIVAVLAVLAGEAAFFGSLPLVIWAAAFLALNHAFFLLYEEPALERRFGEDYVAYKREVPRWLPRRQPLDR